MSEFWHMTTSFFQSDSWNLCDNHFVPITRMVQTLMNYPDETTKDHCISKPPTNDYSQISTHQEKKMKYSCARIQTLPLRPFLPCFSTFCSNHSYTSYFIFCHLFMHYFISSLLCKCIFPNYGRPCHRGHVST